MNVNDEAEISTSAEDKKFASEAVKFVIGHTRNGFVPLCASVATLLKEKAILQYENESLKKELDELRQLYANNEALVTKLQTQLSSANSGLTSKLCKEFDQIQYFRQNRKKVFKTYKPIKGCLCHNCKKSNTNIEGLPPPLTKGDRVVVAGEMCGSVEYIGHVDELNFPNIFIGIQLDEAVGDCNGTYNNKSYFDAPHLRGLFVPLFNVCCVMN